MEEIWKGVVGYEDSYEVSNLGRVRSLDREIPSNLKNCDVVFLKGRIMKLRPNYLGYITVKLGRKDRTVHRLVGFSFLPETYFEGAHINHINSLRNDNRVENLEWVTSKQNSRHGFDFGNHKVAKGSDSRNAKISERDVLEIRMMASNKIPQSKIAARFGISQTQVSRIIQGKRWAHLTSL